MVPTLTERDIDRLEQLLADPAFNGEALAPDALQGFLCAVVSGPEIIPAEVWMRAAVGEAPAYESPRQAEETAKLLAKLHADVVAALEARDFFDLILYGKEENPDELDYSEWCSGYLYGAQVGNVDWYEAAGDDAELLDEHLETFYFLSGILKEESLERGEKWLSEQDEREATAESQKELPETVAAIYEFWTERRMAHAPVRRETPKVGRNHPCPCGSGKKYKLCCGAG